MEFLIVTAGLLLVMWMLIIRPQRRRQLQQADMLAGLETGDEILTAGGLYGRVEALEDDEVLLEIAPATIVRVDKRAVAAVVSPEEPEEEEAVAPDDEESGAETGSAAAPRS